MRLQFKKMAGAGNDFLVFDEEAVRFKKNRSQLARQLCRRKFSVGADGLFFLERLSDSEVRWDFYNADGTQAEMCGNAARCVGLYAVRYLNCEKDITLTTLAGPVKVFYESEENVCVEMPLPKWEVRDPERSILDSGVPHVVRPVESLADLTHEDGTRDRYPAELQNNGANVTFVEEQGEFLLAKTFERGVEDYTLACGTGAIAAGAFAREFLTQKNRNQIRMPGGDLTVEVFADYVHLVGPAVEVFSGSVEEE